jgi:AcrR family transcriptional regulator
VTGTPEQGGRQLLPRAERRASILRGAASAFARSGFSGTSMDDVAAASGVSRLIVYRHFGSKEELYRAVLDGVSVRLTEEFHRGVVGGASGVGARALVRVAATDPDGFRLLWRHASREPTFAAYEAEQRRLAVGAARVLLEARIGDGAPIGWASRTVVAVLVEAVLAWLDEGRPVAEEQLVALLVSAVRAMTASWASSAG